MATFQVSPQSLRLTVVLPSKPARVLPNGSGEEPWNSRSSTTGWAWPLISSSPCSLYSSALTTSARELRKMIFGWFSTSRKSPLFRCPSRCSLLVRTLAASISTSAEDFVGSAWSILITPEKTLKPPRTVATIACRAAKPSRVCAGSRSQVPVRSTVVGADIVASERSAAGLLPDED